MADVLIPPRFREPLAALARLDAEQRSSLEAAYLKASPFPSHVELFNLTKGATGADDQLVLGIVSALLSFTVQLGGWDEPATAVARGAAESPQLNLDQAERNQLAELLEELLRSRALATAAKASDLVSEHEHVFSGIRILTDIRPIFGDDTAGEPDGVTIASTVKLDHYTDGNETSIYIAADEQDLQAIRDSVDRALDKVESMRRLMRKQGLPLYSTASPGEDQNGAS